MDTGGVRGPSCVQSPLSGRGRRAGCSRDAASEYLHAERWSGLHTMACTWDGYISNLMKAEGAKDAVIVGTEPFSVWAAYEGGNLKNIQEEQVKPLLANDTASIFTHGVTLGAKKCAMIRNEIQLTGYADLKVKSSCDDEKHCIAVAKTQKAIIILEGSSGPSSGGKVNMKTFELAEYLKRSGF
ncbi:profilin-1-like [Hypanus sabinus]|uniref:profilin-1-like n=1 Tax=Hypanus sabinus TaxID=79690 RepID=UPI0028C3803C|nr:profilin-1-like [Hypanus sabinus]